MPETMIGPQQSRGHHFKCLNGTSVGFTAGQSGTATMGGVLDALELSWKTDVEAVTVGLPNGLGDPLSLMQAIAGCGRFVVFTAPMIPMSGGSITALLRGDYDAAIIKTFQRLVAAGWGLNSAIRCGWEYNAGAGKGPTEGFPWATNYRDPISGLINGIGQYKLGAAYYENLARNCNGAGSGYQGYFSWCGGNGDTSALPIESAIPTHGNPALTIWDWDIYAGNPYNGSKNNIAASTASLDPIYDRYIAYCEAHGILMAHGEYGQTYKASSPYSIDGLTGWMSWFYAKLKKNNTRVAYAMHYQKNQPVNSSDTNYTDHTILDEMHQLWGLGGWTGSHATVKGTGPYPIGATGPNVNGSLHTLATMGNQQSAQNVTSTFWTATADPNKVDVLADWMANFGGNDPTRGSAGLANPDPVVILPSSAPVARVSPARRRRTTNAFG